MTHEPSYLPNDPSFASYAIHVGSEPDNWSHGDMVPPISVAVLNKQEVPPDHKDFTYSRFGNQTRESLQKCLAKLEDTKYCLVFSSGVAAASTVLKLLKKGDHVAVDQNIYPGIFIMFKELQSETDEIQVSFFDASDANNVDEVLKPNTALVWLESPTNPTLRLVDLKEVGSRIKANNPSTLYVCDNTFMTPYFQRPSSLGADIVMHSCSKFIGGHSDLLMGALCTNNQELYHQLKEKQVLHGPIPSSFDCYLAIRSLKTLEVRMQKHMTNALQVAKFLDSHPKVEDVRHPGLPSHPQHELSLKQCYGHSGIFSFYLITNDIDETRIFLRSLRFITVADSLGGTETTIKMPSLMPKGYYSEEEKKEKQITDELLRISVGLENPQDLIDDLDQALSEIRIVCELQ